MTGTFARLTRGVSLCFLALGVFSAYGWYGHQDPIVGDDDIPKAWNYETKNWMKDIPDTARLGEITLVSSHDAGMNEDRD